MKYLDLVKAEFPEGSKTHQEFLGIMKGFLAKTLDADGVSKRINVLFEELAAQLGLKLPPGLVLRELRDLPEEQLDDIVQAAVLLQLYTELPEGLHRLSSLAWVLVGQHVTEFLNKREEYYEDELSRLDMGQPNKRFVVDESKKLGERKKVHYGLAAAEGEEVRKAFSTCFSVGFGPQGSRAESISCMHHHAV
ncbi:hypothetical protein BC834DRAFT_846583 [Gloeopeniophorella convolvens]|nr:hypothetical protein BC834DRAFT_846583 [Gloeopeniophorella convolvens]